MGRRGRRAGWVRSSAVAGSSATCWTVIRDAAVGDAAARQRFASLYEPVVRSYLRARWSRSGARGEVDDAVQEVFLDCFREDGALQRADPSRPFRAFLYGVVRNIARRAEERRAKERDRHDSADLDGVAATGPSLSEAFDRAWALSLLRQARETMHARAAEGDAAAARRLDLLRLRFEAGLPIREIARRWGRDAAWTHREYRRARRDFREALLEALAFHHPASDGELETEARRLLGFFL